MIRSPLLELHALQRERIIEDTGLKVYDDFPGLKESMPYVVMGEMTMRPWDDKFEHGQEVTSTMHVWSSYPGRKEVLEITDKIVKALSREELSFGERFKAVFSSLDSVNVIIDIDGVTRHAVVSYRYLIEQNGGLE